MPKFKKKQERQVIDLKQCVIVACHHPLPFFPAYYILFMIFGTSIHDFTLAHQRACASHNGAIDQQSHITIWMQFNRLASETCGAILPANADTAALCKI